jgi:hypothetical protein
MMKSTEGRTSLSLNKHRNLRVIGQEMVDTVRHEVEVANDTVIGYVSLAVEYKSMKAVFDQTKEQQSEEGGQDEGERVEGFP